MTLLNAVSKVVLVIPCLNESRRLNEHFLTSFLDEPDLHIQFVDDGSTDQTGDWLRSFASRHPGRASVLVLAEHQGKGEAVRQGIALALEQNPVVIGYVDSDGATPAQECLRLLGQLHEMPAEVIAVLGSRVKLLGFDIRRRPMRHYLGRIFATMASWILSLPVYDTQCGAKFFRNSPLIRRAFETSFHSRWLFDVELIGRLVIGIRATGGDPDGVIREIPLRVWHDREGSKRRPWDYGRAAIDLIRMAISLSSFGR